MNEKRSLEKLQLFREDHRALRSNGVSVWVTDGIAVEDIRALFPEMPDPSSEILMQGTKLLKQAGQRLVFQAEALGLPNDKAVLKMFPLKNPSSMLRYRKYARREFINYHKARQKNVPVPKIYAYLEKRRFGFVTGSGIIIEWLEGQRDLKDIASHSAKGYASAAKLGIPALVALYNAGAMHIDARDENIFLSADNASTDFCVIDWQYASFHSPRSEWMLEHLAAYYIRNAPATESDALCGEWLLELHTQAGHSTTFETFLLRVKALLSARQSVRARLNLRPAKNIGDL